MRFEPVREADLTFFRDLLGPARVHTGSAIADEFAHDELGEARHLPDVVLEPGSTEEVAAILRYANDHRLPVTPRGSGTGLCGGATPVCGGILLSLARLDKIIEIDEQNLTATVEAGVILLNFQETVERLGLMYPPDPGEKSATIGGNVMTNAGGMRAVKYGVTRDYVRGLQAVLPSGQVIEVGGKVAKNSSGYSLLHLLVGSEGTLATVTRVTVRLVPLPKKTVSLLVPFQSLPLAIRAVPQLALKKINAQAIEFMEREVIEAAEDYLGKQFPDRSAPAYLLIRFDGNSMAELEGTIDAAAQVCLESGADDVLIADTIDRQAAIWEARGAFLEALKAGSLMDEVDVVVPRDRIATFIEFTKEIEQAEGLRIRSFGHAGDGNLHVYLMRDDLSESDWHDRLERAMARLYARGRELGGQVSGEHGIGYAKRTYLSESIGMTQLQLMRGIKAVFDPHGIMNPDKVLE
ncbi:MAG: FAD-binding oxidoreductase [Chloroflexota bacterium]